MCQLYKCRVGKLKKKQQQQQMFTFFYKDQISNWILFRKVNIYRQLLLQTPQQMNDDLMWRQRVQFHNNNKQLCNEKKNRDDYCDLAERNAKEKKMRLLMIRMSYRQASFRNGVRFFMSVQTAKKGLFESIFNRIKWTWSQYVDIKAGINSTQQFLNIWLHLLCWHTSFFLLLALFPSAYFCPQPNYIYAIFTMF